MNIAKYSTCIKVYKITAILLVWLLVVAALFQLILIDMGMLLIPIPMINLAYFFSIVTCLIAIIFTNIAGEKPLIDESIGLSISFWGMLALIGATTYTAIILQLPLSVYSYSILVISIIIGYILLRKRLIAQSVEI